MTPKFAFSLFIGRAFKMMKNGIYFILIALLVLGTEYRWLSWLSIGLSCGRLSVSLTLAGPDHHSGS